MLGRLPWKMQLLLILMALLLPSGTGADPSSHHQILLSLHHLFSLPISQPFWSHQIDTSVNKVITAEYFLPEEIIGGREARPHSHPFMAYLLAETPTRQSFCGGFLVREDFVMTAAHCWGSTITVILGAHNISRQERTQQRISVLRATRHPGYNEENNLNDIMLLQLENRARQNQFVRPVALPLSRTELRPGSRCTVAGWGLVSQNRRTDTLRDAQLRVQRDQVCSNLFNTYNGQKQICVGDQNGEETTFRGDTGGPLVCNNVAQGIVSYGRSIGAPPTVFTRIARFLPWINNTMRQSEHKGSH